MESGPSGPALYGRPLKTRGSLRTQGTKHWLVIRPERLRWKESEGSDCNFIEGEATDVIYQGDSYLVRIRLPDGIEIDLRRAPEVGVEWLPALGETVRLWLDREHTIFVAD